MNLSFRHISKSFGQLSVLENLSLEVAAGEFVALVGPSGSGKSTILHLAAGLEPSSSGLIEAGGSKITGASPERTLVFQEHALYPWLTLERNVALAREFQGLKRKEALKEAQHWLSQVQLDGFEHYYPHQVSGGMRQRAALARAFIARPKLLLLDEPFGALDALTRMALQDVLLQLIEAQKLTVMLVTHDVDEALYLTSRILVFSQRPAQCLADIEIGKNHAERDPAVYAEERQEILSLLGIRQTNPLQQNSKEFSYA